MSFAFFSDYAGSSSGFYALLHYNDTSVGPISKVKNCSPENPCNANEGQCHNDDDCDGTLRCGQDNCPAYAGYANGTNCCYDYCAKWLDLSTGTLTSPNFPNNYDSNTACGWPLAVEENKVITIEINSFRVSFFN